VVDFVCQVDELTGFRSTWQATDQSCNAGKGDPGRGFVDAANGCFAEENPTKLNGIAGSPAWRARHNPQDGKLWLRDINDTFVAITTSLARSYLWRSSRNLILAPPLR
jgi:hypothetical protein